MKTLSLLVICFAICANAQDSSALKLAKTIPMPGVTGRFDHFAIDAKGHRLFVAALGNDTLEVLDIGENKRLQSITGLHKPTGAVHLPGRNQLGVANGGDDTFKVFAQDSDKLLHNVGALDDADNVRLDAKTGLIYVGYAAGALAVIDSATMMKTANIRLAAHPESFQLEQAGDRIFVNVTEAHQIAVIDRKKQAVTAIWPLVNFKANFPMALDEANHRLFIGCRQPSRLVVLDTNTGRTVADLAISGDTDDLFYDASHKRLYLSCGEGFVDVIQQLTPDSYQRREQIPTRAGARTSFYSAELNQFYLAVPKRGTLPAEIRIYNVQ